MSKSLKQILNDNNKNIKKYIDDIKISYENKQIKISNNYGVNASIDASDFIKDGMINSVELVDKNDENTPGQFLKITWNTDADTNDVTYVDVTTLVDVYNGVDGDTVKVEVSANNDISAEVKTGVITDDHIATDASISKSKLAFDVQESLDKANTAIQSLEGYATNSYVQSEAEDKAKEYSTYDTIINSQEEWDAMVASPDWNGARNILLKCYITASQTYETIKIPSNVLSIEGSEYQFSFGPAILEASEEAKTSLKNLRMFFVVQGRGIKNINGIYNCRFSFVGGNITNCKNIIGCTFERIDSGSVSISNCDTIILDTASKEFFDSKSLSFNNCTNIIYEKTKLSEFENDTEYALLSDIPVGDGESTIQSGADGVKAEGDYSVATGYAHKVNGVEYYTTSKGTGSVAMGKGNTTYGKQSVAFGCFSTTGDANGTAWEEEGEPFEGTDTPGEDLGKNSIAAGYKNTAWGESTIAMGSSNLSKGKSSVTLGNTNKAYGYGNVALGFDNNVGEETPVNNTETDEKYYGHGSGGNNSQSNAVVAIGRENHISDTQSVGIGTDNKVYSKNVLAFGTSNIVNTNGDNSIVIGKSNEVTNIEAIALGYNNNIDKANGIAIGSNQVVGKDGQIVIGNGGVEEEKADIILNGPNTNILSLSEADGAYTFDINYHEFTYPIADCRYFNYSTSSRGPVFVADMERTGEVPHLLKGQKIIITINGVEYSSTLGTVWALNELGNFTQKDIFGQSRPTLKAAAFMIKETTEHGPIYTALNALGSLDNIINNVTFKIEDTSLNLGSIRVEEKTKTINAITLGKNPSVSSGTIFAIGNAAHLSDGYEHNAFEVKNNGDIITEGNILNPNGTSKIPKKISELENDVGVITYSGMASYVHDELSNSIGEIDAVLDELHNYAQALIAGGEA